MIDVLEWMSQASPKRFRGFVRMSPTAFYDLVKRLRKTNAFHNGRKDHAWVAERVATVLYRFGRSRNGASLRDVAVNCGCSEGSVVNWTNMTIEALNEIKDEIIHFATEDERQKASAWVQEKSGVEEWGKGWAVVDGSMINLAWKPALHSRQYFNYKVSLSLWPVVNIYGGQLIADIVLG
jgi:hypothetical protein